MGSVFGAFSDPGSGQSPASSVVRNKLNHLREILSALLVTWVDDAANCTLKPGIGAVPGDLAWSASASTSRPGYLPCDGQLYSRATYPALYAAIGDLWGSNDGSTNFRVPPANVMPFGAGGSYAVGATGGEITHLLTAAESGSPAHAHTVPYVAAGTPGTTHGLMVTGNSVGGYDQTTTSSATPAAQAHNNMPPYATYKAWIKT
jgi:microcystin-dependent protein